MLFTNVNVVALYSDPLSRGPNDCDQRVTQSRSPNEWSNDESSFVQISDYLLDLLEAGVGIEGALTALQAAAPAYIKKIHEFATRLDTRGRQGCKRNRTQSR